MNENLKSNEKLSSRETLDYIVKLSEAIAESARKAKAMLEMADQKSLEINIEREIDPFRPMGNSEKQLVNLRGDTGRIVSAIFSKGLEVTPKELSEFRNKQGLEVAPEELS